MPKILILDAESSAGIESLQTLGRAGAVVHAASADEHCLAFHSRYCAAAVPQPARPDELLAWLTARHAEHAYDLIIPATEKTLMVFADPQCSESLRQKAVVPSRESLALAINKESIWHLANTLSVSVPASVLASSASVPAIPYEYPVAVKPVQSKQITDGRIVDRRVAYAHNEAQLLEILASAPESSFQIQELIHGYGVGIELLFAHGEPVLHFAHERIHELPLTGGGSSYRKSIPPPPALLAQSIALLKALHWHGVAMVEWKVDPHKDAVLIEINPRLWGSLALAIDAGADFPRGLLAVAQGNPLPPQKPARTPYYTRDLTRDFEWQIANFRADHTNPQLLTQPRLASAFELLRPLLFKESWDFFDFADPGITLRRIGSYFSLKLSALTGKVQRKFRNRRFLRTTHPRILAETLASPHGPKNILFLCYGNICRSPLAELAAHTALPGHIIQSAGFHPKVNRRSPAHVQRSATRLGIDMDAHRSRQVTSQDIDQADLVLVMDWKNYAQLLRAFPQSEKKTTFLGLFNPSPTIEIEDPYDLTGARVDQVVDLIANATQGLAAKLPPLEKQP